MSEKNFKIKIGIIGGTGLNSISIFEDSYELEVDTIYGKPSDKLLCGKINNVECVLLSRHDKSHLTGPSQVNYRANLLALKDAGCNVLIVTTACGSLNEKYKPGDIVILDDFIDRTSKREQTFYDGVHTKLFNKTCHIPMYPAFCSVLRDVLIEQCRKANISHHKTGTMVTIEGPRFSSRAESKMFQQWGGHCINMTTCPEVVLAKELGMPYASIAIVTDYDCWRDHDGAEHVDVESVLRVFRANIGKVTSLIVNAVPEVAAKNWQDTLKHSQDVIKSSIV
jgi:5'-methylthioadenosine phosphorylase